MVGVAVDNLANKNFLASCLEAGKRLDGREFLDFRKFKINFSSDTGFCQVELGATLVSAQVSCEVVRPHTHRATEGFLTFNTTFSRMSSPLFAEDRPTDLEISISRLLEKSLKQSRAVDTEGLCIVSGEKVWSVNVDCHVLSFGGNVVDCACIAAVMALSHFRRPDVTVNGEQVQIYLFEEKNPVPLCLKFMPLCITFAVLNGGNAIVCDPTREEEECATSILTVCVNRHREVCVLQKLGGTPLAPQQILECFNYASVKAIELTEKLEKILESVRDT